VSFACDRPGTAFPPAVGLVARLWQASPLPRRAEDLGFNLTGWPAVVDNGVMAAVAAAVRGAGVRWRCARETPPSACHLGVQVIGADRSRLRVRGALEQVCVIDCSAHDPHPTPLPKGEGVSPDFTSPSGRGRRAAPGEGCVQQPIARDSISAPASYAVCHAPNRPAHPERARPPVRWRTVPDRFHRAGSVATVAACVGCSPSIQIMWDDVALSRSDSNQPAGVDRARC
jgi:hypothetical protein